MNDNLLVHKHLIVRAEVYRPPMDEKFERKFDSLTWWIIGGLGSTIALLLTLAFNLIK